MEIFEIYPNVLFVITGLVGLIFGSFLTVVAYRVPIMLGRSWREQCAKLEAEDAEPKHAVNQPFNLIKPNSICPECVGAVTARHKIPILSYILLRGCCAQCGTKISMSYPFIETITVILSLVVTWVFGPSWQLLLALPITWTLLVLSVIDIDHKLLPDSITLPLMWAGLLASLFRTGGDVIFTNASSSVVGAAAGYLSLWGTYQVFKLVTGKEGMGYGDFKLLSALGAWLGWQLLPLVIMLSAAAGAVIGTIMIALGQSSREKPIPFGPYLAMAGWIALLWGGELMESYLLIMGWPRSWG